MTRECSWCSNHIETGDTVLVASFTGDLFFCGSNCAGEWFIETQCVSETMVEDDE
jgi:ribosomal protein L24E